MLRGVIIAALLVTGCGGPTLSDNQRSEVENIAEDFADGAAVKTDTSDLEERIEKLEAMVKLQDETDDFDLKQLEEMNRDMAEMNSPR